jgi:hypothetical protein
MGTSDEDVVTPRHGTPETTENRSNPGWFKKGVTLNPRGRPRVNKDLREMVQRQQPKLTRILLQHAMRLGDPNGGPDPATSFKAMKLLLAYGLGTPVARTEITGPGDGHPQFLSIAFDLETRIAELAAREGLTLPPLQRLVPPDAMGARQ